MTEYIYFASFRAAVKRDRDTGNIRVVTSLPITTWEDIERVENAIKEQHSYESVVLINYQLLREDAASN